MHLHFLKLLLFVNLYAVEMCFAQTGVCFSLALPLNKQKKQMPNLFSPPFGGKTRNERLKRLFCEARAIKITEKVFYRDTRSPS